MLDLSYLKQLRRDMGLTQHELAKGSGVSQSLVAKIEAGEIDPRYSSVRKLEEFLSRLKKGKEKTAGQVMTTKVVSIHSQESVKKAIERMRQHAISQMPVIDDGHVVGSLSETILLDAITKNKEFVHEVMGDIPPLIPLHAPLSMVLEILKVAPFVMVNEKGKFKGIITKADLLRGFLT
ncbi:CBS domain-containing protein [Candidatus Woesearchaeota archaeon]|nr:CBS domain-containing protein [Candidatus Woesearchaeota archaeon]